MSHPTELDLGPLTWVKSEIDLALARAAEALEQAGDAADRAARIQFAQTHLHQARGALSIVGLDGLTQFAAALDQLLSVLARSEGPIAPEALELARRALAAIGNYLEELTHGASDQPLRLASLYLQLAEARGATGVSAADLFFPDLAQRPPRRATETPVMDEADRQRHLRALRSRFERGLLGWLRNPKSTEHARLMRDAVAGIELLQTSAPQRALWWASVAFLDGLVGGCMNDEAAARHLCAQLNIQMRRLLGGSATVPDRLMREVLYQVAVIPVNTEVQRAVHDTWHLDVLVPEAGATVSDVPLLPLLQGLRSTLANAKDAWNEFCGGTAAALPRFEKDLAEVASQGRKLGRPAFDRLLAGVGQFAQWLRKDPLRFNETIAIEVATALLLGDAALDQGIPAGGFSNQVADTLTRLSALMRGETVQAAESSPTVEVARRAQEREAVGQLAREIRSSLGHIEQVLDDYFRDQSKRAPLAGLAAPLKQIEGALTLLGETAALELVHDAAQTIAGFAASETPADPEAFANLAHRLSALGFYVGSLQHGGESLEYFLDPEAARQAAAAEEEEEDLPPPAPVAAEIPAEPAPAAPVAAVVEQFDSPDALAPALEFDLSLDDTPAPAAAATPATAEIEEFEPEPRPAPPPVPEPAPETRKLIEEASDEEIDAELLAIFIEEAHEVLATIGEHLELLRTEPSNTDYLTAIRRGFHTLKGSGRMVGLRDLGEAAWGMEQTLNCWLQLEWKPTPALHHLIGAAHQLFGQWVDQLEAGGPHGFDAAALLAEAERLRSSDDAVAEPAPLAEPAPTPASAAPEAPVNTQETSLELLDLSISEQGEVLPYGSQGEAQAFDLQETSLEELVFHEDDEPEEIQLGEEFILEDEPAAADAPTQPAEESHLESAPAEEGGEESTAAEAGNDLAIELAELPDSAEAAPSVPATPEDGGDIVLPSLDSASLDEPAPEEAALDGAFETVELPDLEPEAAPVAGQTLELTDAAAPGESALEDALVIEGIELEALAEDPTEPQAEHETIAIEALEPAASGPRDVEEPAATDDLAVEEFDLPPLGSTELHEFDLGTDLEALEADESLLAASPAAIAEEKTLEAVPAEEIPVEAPVAVETEAEDAAPVEAEPAAVAQGAAETGPETAPASPAADLDSDYIKIGDVEISRPLFDLYQAEARHHLAILHAEFNRLQANPTLLPPEPSLRAAHTLAGISGTARVMTIHALARALEHAQERLRDSVQPPTAEQTELFRTTADTLEAMLAEVCERRMPLEVPELAEQLEAVGRAPRIDDEPSPVPAALEDVATDAPPEALAKAVEASAAANATATPPAPTVHDDLDRQLLPIFLEEGAELLTQLHATLRAWQDDQGSTEHPKAAARLLHTLKGSARMAGAMTLGEHVHKLESRFEAVQRSGQGPAALIEELTAGLDITEQMIDVLASGGSLEAVVAAAEATAPEVAADVPAAPAHPAAAEAAPAQAESEVSTAMATLRVRADAVDRFVNEAGEIGIARTRIEGELRTLRRSLLDLTENVIRLRNQLREVEIQADVQMQSRLAQAETHHAEFDPLEMDRYTRLQELTRMMAESVNDVTTVQQNLLKNLDAADVALHAQARISRDLQQALMQVRMVPFDSLADRLYRIVRQSAKELGKRANLDLRGGRMEIDRGLLERVVAPLEHLLRNALAHGIEAPEVRRAAGKPELGQITLSVRQEGNEVAIELTDDGAGLDFARIAERARANGLLAPGEQADERRLTNLIFVPGFSTAGAVSAVSGRGVGMDVVKSETAAVGGRIDVHSTPGNGCVFRIYLPLTLAVTQALLVRAGNRTHAIPSSMIAQVLELKTPALERLRAEGGYDWQGERFVYRYLPRLLGDYTTQPEEQRFNWVLLLRAGAQTLALHVDSLRGNQEIVVKNAGPQLARIVGISGATVLGDGEIVLIINPIALASRGLGVEEAPGLPDGQQPQAAAPAYVPTIMVVDDSLTVRKITGRLLEREGYRVITAKDGVDALEKLLETVPDVILSDIEMPRMDGFDFVRNVRADDRTRNVPVVMITSRLADKHRRYAEEVGANHYLGKPYQEDELLDLLKHYTAGHQAVPAAATAG